MRTLLRVGRLLIALVLMSSAGALPACGSMGGGMKYLLDPAVEVSTSVGL